MTYWTSNQKLLAIFGGIILCLWIGSAVSIYFLKSESTEPLLTTQTDQVVVFYRNDCGDCQKVLPQLLLRNLWHLDTTFVNMNDPENHGYIQRFHLNEVPTIYHNQRQYAGTNRKKIQELLRAVPAKKH